MAGMTWVLGAHFDFEQEFPNYTETEHRLHLRLRSDGKMFCVFQRMWREDSFEEMFEYFLADDPMSFSYTPTTFWEYVTKCIAEKDGRNLKIDIGESA